MSRIYRQLAIGLALFLPSLLDGRDAFGQGRSQEDVTGEQTFQDAEAAFNAHQDDDALHLYEKVNGINPSRCLAWARRGTILYKRKQYAAGVTLLEQAKDRWCPNDLDVNSQLGLSLYRGGKPEAAVKLLEEVTERQPDLPQVQLQLCEHYVKVADGKKGVVACEAYFQYRPESAAGADPKVRALSGAAYLLNLQYPEARRDLEAALKYSPNDDASRLLLGAVYTALNECRKAVLIYEHLIKEAPRQPSIWFNLATCQLRLHRRVQAEPNATAYVGARPSDAKGFVLVGDLQAEGRSWAKAVVAYETAKKLEPAGSADGAAIDAKLGAIYLTQKNYPAAVAALESASRAKPDDSAVLTELAETYAASGAPKDKLASVADRLAHATADARAQLGAGIAWYALGDDDRALKAFAAATAASPKDYRPRVGARMALLRMAGVQVDKGDLAAAEDSLAHAQKVDPDSVQVNRNLGLVLLAQKKFAEAEVALKAAAERVPYDRVVNRLLGRTDVGLKKRDDALRFYETAAQSALRARGPALAEVYAELGPLYLDAGKYDQAVNVLETAVKESAGDRGGTVSLTAARNLALAYLRRGLERLKDPHQNDGALEDLGRAAASPRPALAAKEATAVRCAYALATLKVGKPQTALDELARASREGGCQFRSPYDKNGLEFFTAFAAYRESNNAAKLELAAKGFQRLLPHATGAMAELLRELVRSSYEFEGVDLYARGERKKSGVVLRNAARVTTRSEHRELDNNLAVIDLEEGRTDTAERGFEGVGNKPPEALANLGIINDRKGDPKKALELYKRAVDRGARSPRLKEWIDVKERMFARAGGEK
jgi:tetratricopeptide (TPR) repeat protein